MNSTLGSVVPLGMFIAVWLPLGDHPVITFSVSFDYKICFRPMASTQLSKLWLRILKSKSGGGGCGLINVVHLFHLHSGPDLTHRASQHVLFSQNEEPKKLELVSMSIFSQKTLIVTEWLSFYQNK